MSHSALHKAMYCGVLQLPCFYLFTYIYVRMANNIQLYQVSHEEQRQIAKATVGQFGNPLYEQEKKKRLTASNFGSVIKRRVNTPCHNLVKRLLYTTHG